MKYGSLKTRCTPRTIDLADKKNTRHRRQHGILSIYASRTALSFLCPLSKLTVPSKAAYSRTQLNLTR